MFESLKIAEKDNIYIRKVNENDIERLVEIYSYYVENTAISFEYNPPTIEEFKYRVDKLSKKYPYLVAQIDGRVVGYVYASAYNTREAYNWTVTMSIYVDKDYKRCKIGSALYEAIEEKLKEQGIVNMMAAVAYVEKEDEYLTQDSYKFHIKNGYIKVGQMKKVGKKFDRWYDLLWLQKVIAEAD